MAISSNPLNSRNRLNELTLSYLAKLSRAIKKRSLVYLDTINYVIN